jgi:hypothetical protein
MDIGIVVGVIIGSIVTLIGFYIYIDRNHQKKDIKNWMAFPQTVAKITGSQNKHSRDDNYSGYSYRAEILIDGVWYKAESTDTFKSVKKCKKGDEEKKTRYWFKFMDERMYDGEETHIGYAIFCVCFGLLVIVISYLAMIGVI